MSSRSTIEPFDAECSALSRALELLTAEDFVRPTNCPPWTLHELVVHVADSLAMPDAGSPPPAEGWPVRSAADYYCRPERHTDEYRGSNVARTRRRAATVAPETTAALLRTAWQRASGTFSESGLDQRPMMRHRGPATTFLPGITSEGEGGHG